MFKYKEEYSHLTNACLNLTDACNLACRYCFVAQQPHFMNYQTAQDSVDWLIQNKRWKELNGIKCDQVRITYFGGEPTLLWDEIIVPLTKYATEKYPNEVYFGMTTNGTLLDEERVKFLADYKFGILLSIDGAPYTQNYNRPCHNSNQNSFDLVVKNIPYILKYFPNTTFRSTIDEDTVDRTFENYIFAQYMGFKNMFMIPNGRVQWKQENLSILEDEFKRIYYYMITYFEKNQMPPINFSPINDSFKRLKDYNTKILYPDTTRERNCVRCGLGTSLGSIGYDGKIYGCQEQDSKEMDSRFYIGDIYNGISEDIHSGLLQEYLNFTKMSCGDKPEYCDTCPLNKICGFFNCPSSSYDLFQSFNKDNYVHCYWFRILHNCSSVMLKYLQNNETFKKYLINKCNYDFLKKED